MTKTLLYLFQISPASRLVTKKTGQIIVLHQPIFPWNKGISFTKPPVGGQSVVWGRELIWPEKKNGCMSFSLSALPVPLRENFFRHAALWHFPAMDLLDTAGVSYVSTARSMACHTPPAKVPSLVYFPTFPNTKILNGTGEFSYIYPKRLPLNVGK